MKDWSQSIMSRTFTVFGMFFLFVSPIHAQNSARVMGKVLDKDSIPIAFASIALKGTSIGCSSQQDGSFEFKAPAGQYTLSVMALGYKSIDKKIDLSVGSSFMMNFFVRSRYI